MGSDTLKSSSGKGAPLLYNPFAAETADSLRTGLREAGWQGAPGGQGEAMIQLFSRLSDLVATRLNSMPENHFREFLNTAGVDLLSPEPARTEITFSPGKGAPPVIRVPAGTQLSAKKNENRGEIVFETERDLNVVKSELECCIVTDPLRISDRTAEALQGTGSFAVWQGDEERTRRLYITDGWLFEFPDEASRRNATVTLNVTIATPGSAAQDGWNLQWRYFDGNGWCELKAGLEDATFNLSQSGEIRFRTLPEMAGFPLDKQRTAWLECRLTGGRGRNHLPVVKSICGSRYIEVGSSTPKPPEALFSAIHSGSAYISLEPGGEFFPFGQRPGRLDAFYLKADEVFTKNGASVTISMDLVGLPAGVSGGELNALRIEWEHFSSNSWKKLGESARSGMLSSASGLIDNSDAFTSGGTGVTVSFNIPDKDDTSTPAWSCTKVNGVDGYWLRARITAGGYGTEPEDTTRWTPPQVLPPSVKNLKISFAGYAEQSAANGPLEGICSLVDSQLRSHNQNDGDFAPFSSCSDFPALYLGFSSGFPANEWIQLLLDVDEGRNSDRETATMVWEYCLGGGTWNPIPASDGSCGLKLRGYLGFNAPADQGKSLLFARELFWLRGRAHIDPPQAKALTTVPPRFIRGEEATVTVDASASCAFDGVGIAKYNWRILPPEAVSGEDINATVSGNEAKVTLDASRTAEVNGREILRYRWRLVSSGNLIARGGDDITVSTKGGEARVSLDFSASFDAEGGEINRYILRKIVDDTVPTFATTYLRGIRCNTVPALNGITVANEILGSSNGRKGLSLSLSKSCIAPDIRIYVRENDQPPTGDIPGLQPGDESALPVTVASRDGVWVLWRRVDHFQFSSPSSRVFMLDSQSGTIIFSDGVRGMIPPVGRDNIKAAYYRAHSGEAGNVGANEITVIRNPVGELAAVKKVRNFEKAVSGGDAEDVSMAMVRGPRTIKHRDRGITLEDYAWLARDAGREVAAAWCLPARDPDGMTREGWVTVVIVPDEPGVRPFPSPPLLRHVRSYLKSRALPNLSTGNSIVVRGPRYVEAAVNAKVVPINSEKGDEVKLAAISRLEEFLHPLKGGQERKGWELGRDIYLSELYSELESLPGVDHVAELSVSGSIQQMTVTVTPRSFITRSAVQGSRVGTFDDRFRLLLAETLEPSNSLTSLAPIRISLYGFRVGDLVDIVDSSNRVIVEAVAILSIALGNDSVTIGMDYGMTENLPSVESLALLSTDGGLRIPLTGWMQGVGDSSVAGIMLLMPGVDRLCIVSGGQRYPEFEFMGIEFVEPRSDRVTVPQGHLVNSGTHFIEMVQGG